MKKVVNILGNIVFYSILIFFITIVIITVKAKKNGEIPSFGGYRVFKVLTGSMSPSIDEGSLIIIKETSKDNIKPDDVITFKFEGTNTVVTHRVVEIIDDGEEFITKGDANNAIDPRNIKYSEVQGVVIKHIHSLGYYIELISKNIIKIITLILGVILLYSIITNSLSKDSKNIAFKGDGQHE